MKITILGCGPSYGVPSLSRGFGDCDPLTPENKRSRTAAVIEVNGYNILIDSGPDIREQLLRTGIRKIDALLYTHAHYDHMGGADDLRVLFQETNQKLPVYGVKKDLIAFKSLLSYLFEHSDNKNIFELHEIESGQAFMIYDIPVIPILQQHGSTTSIGYRIQDFAYSTDVKAINETGFNALQGISTWILGVVTKTMNNKHINLDEARDWINKIHPQKAYLTHMGSKMDYHRLCDELPAHIRPCYDGMIIEI